MVGRRLQVAGGRWSGEGSAARRVLRAHHLQPTTYHLLPQDRPRPPLGSHSGSFTTSAPIHSPKISTSAVVAGTAFWSGRSRLRSPLQATVELHAVHHHPGEGDRGPELAHESRRMPGGAAGEIGALHQDDPLPTESREVIGDAGAGETTTDDDAAGLRRQVRLGRHERSPARGRNGGRWRWP